MRMASCVDVGCMMSNNHNALHCVNIRPKCLAARKDLKTDRNELMLKA